MKELKNADSMKKKLKRKKEQVTKMKQIVKR